MEPELYEKEYLRLGIRAPSRGDIRIAMLMAIAGILLINLIF